VSLRTELFDYPLPERLIAQTPVARRDQSRLLVVDRGARTVAHHVFADLPGFLHAGDILFRNNAAVLPARLFAQRPTGGQVECFLLRPAGPVNEWWCLLRPGRKLPAGATFVREGAFTAIVLAKEGDGTARVAFTTPGGESIVAAANRLGVVPLPPYIRRRHTADERRLDLERYQTVYADRAHQVAVAAPTAGLHFTPELLARLAAGGVRFADLTLHVGPGTFRPITTAIVEEHVIHRETCELPPETQRLLFAPGNGRRLVVGTTTVRSVEDFLSTHQAPTALSLPAVSPSTAAQGLSLSNGLPDPSKGSPYIAETDLFIYPPRAFRGVDALITNFHQPRSTLLCLVAAFLTPGSTDGIAWIREIYAEAVAREYRFFSYGDAMLIL
jgi:S-adenosylmethionine:tRNA ribosyltransferase-isomerase